MNEDKSEFLICDCQGHGLMAEKFKGENEVHLSIFERGLTGRVLSWSDRMRWCWQILAKGVPWCDYIILNDKEKEKLKKFLL